MNPYEETLQACLTRLCSSRVSNNGTLVIASATANDEGSYLCKVNNGVGDGISKLISVEVNGMS